METVFSILNFEDGGVAREINSPRSLEACLRAGLDPLELIPKSKKEFYKKDLTEEMVTVKFESFEKKRRG